MSLQNYSNNPIARRKAAVRRYTRNGIICVGAGVVGGAILALMSSHVFLLLGLIVAVVGGTWNWMKVKEIINHRD
ncbi:hypothetical protein GP475_07705 [Corynebacterium poyangense]|uniref:Uncharacterized protein n=1 Tax=Corynebacterium poyangense TaxID=2684405 RepID=A0A7H0SPR0_9CORY|nr:hypothetical protein [Corynebacterium poyangense]QNQ90535.1 hypothetical protein GP475_07705 [Corynebacterium poyangense]